MSGKPASGIRAVLLVAWAIGAAPPGHAQSNPAIESFFRQNIGLNQDNIRDIRTGTPVVRAMPTRTPAEVVLFGAVFVAAAPEVYFEYAGDLERRRKLPAYLALGICSDPPQLADWKGFSFENDDIQALRKCKPGDCQVQLSATSMQDFQQTIDWTASDANEQVNQLLRETANKRLLSYQRDGNAAMATYHDKSSPVDAAKRFGSLLGYARAFPFPLHLPDFYRYLLEYPKAKPANVLDAFYWAKVKFGLKPTLRIVHVLKMRGNPAEQLACAIAEKQFYASHYFEAALDLKFCIRSLDSNRPGFYLVIVVGSEQAGLTGPKGSIIRREAVGRSLSDLRDALSEIKRKLEN